MRISLKLRIFVAAFFILHNAAARVEDVEPAVTEIEVKEKEENFKEIRELIKDFEIISNAGKGFDFKSGRKLERDLRSLQIESITGTFLQLNNLFKNAVYCNKFLDWDGIDTVILPALDFLNDDVKSDALMLLRTLIEVIPPSDRDKIENDVLEKVIDTFENVGSFPVKRRALDIIQIWLPRNPKAQARVMKKYGIEPFYDQIGNLDTPSVNDLIELFISIVEEHIKIMKSVGPKTEEGLEQVEAYERVGLLKQISSRKICNGLAEILDKIWDDRELYIPQVCRLLKVMKPFCLRKLKGKHDYLEFFEEIERFVNNESNKNFFDDVNEVLVMVKAYKKVVLGKHTEL